MPKDVRNAVVAIEDERFYKHKGVDYGAIVRAGVKNLESGKNLQGGSTITQQLVRALYIKDPKRNIQRKIREAKLASELEKEHSKAWILTNYLNDVPVRDQQRAHRDRRRGRGRGALRQARQGPDAAAGRAARRPAAGAVAVQPFPQPDAALQRRSEVLQKMVDNGFITRAQATEANDARPRPQARHALHPPPRALLLRLRRGEADRALRRRRLPPRRA